MRHPLLVCCLVASVFAAGCAGSSRIAEKPRSLDQVNSTLEGRTSLIVLTNGKRLSNLRMVRVAPDTTYYRSYGSPRGVEHVPTAQVAQIRFRADSGARDGFIIGVVPGLALGIAGLIAYQEDSDGGGGLIGYTAVIGGAALALAGGLVGVIVGNSLGKHEVVVYEQPLDAYLGDTSDR